MFKICVHCDKNLHTIVKLNRHLRQYKCEKQFVCDLCSKMFRLPKELENHKNIKFGCPNKSILSIKSVAHCFSIYTDIRESLLAMSFRFLVKKCGRFIDYVFCDRFISKLLVINGRTRRAGHLAPQIWPEHRNLGLSTAISAWSPQSKHSNYIPKSNGLQFYNGK